MKKLCLFLLVALFSTSMNAQFFNNLGKAISSTVNTAQSKPNNSNNSGAQNGSSSSTKAAAAPVGNGKVYYVSVAGSGRADGLTPATAKKDLQKALDLCENGDIVRIAEGNYLGALDAGYVEIKKFITLEGGWNADFTARDPYKYITRMQPTHDQDGTNGSKALIHISGLDDINCKIGGTLVIDGLMLDYGLQNAYLAYDPNDARTGSPEGVETGRMVDDGSKQLSHQLIHNDAAIAGNVIIRNCMLLNGPYFGIQINTRAGKIEVYNNVILSCRYSGCRIDGWDKDGTHSTVDFHHNTVGFSWCRDKMMEDMGYGYEFMNKVNADVHHNIFLCNNYAALARTRAMSGPDAVIEARKVTNVYDNYFFLNAADLQLPSAGGGKWTNVMSKNFEDVDEKILPKYEGNKELSKDDACVKALWQPYLKGFTTLKVLDESSNLDRNSSANQLRSAFGMNLQGSEIHRVSMFGNRYNFDEAMKLFGAKAGYGAQK